MPDTKISDLPSAGALIGTEFIPVVQESQTVKTTFTAVQNTVVAAVTPAIALKAPIASPTFTGSVTAPTFVGALTGTATSATALAAGADRTKLDGIATGATANSSDATLLARANHTGTQLVTTISNLGTGTVTATGASTARSLAAYFADRVNVKNFGATGDGTTDDSVAVMAAFAAGRLLSFGAHIYFPTGKYNLASMTASSTLRVFSGVRVSGDGYANTTLIWNDDDGVSLFRGPSSGRVTDCVLEDFAIRGTQDTRGNASAYPILITACDNIHIRRLLVEKSRVFAIAIRSSKNVTVQDCVIRLCGRDGINIAQATRYIITGNQISNCDDDGIAAHTDATGQESTPNGGVISGNTLFDCQGIKVLGARHCVISDNVLDCVKAQGISVWPVAHDGSGTEGVSSMLNVVISNNKISNVLDRAAVDALNGNNYYINIGGHSAQAGTLAAVPGEPDTATGTIVSYYDYVNSNGTATTVPTPGSNGVVISGNIFSRTLKGGVAFSTYGRGLIFSRGGWYDPVFSTLHVGQSNGVVVTTGVLKNVQISDNIFTGLNTGIVINNHVRIDSLVVKDNLFWDILNYGCIVNPGGSGHILRAYVESNIFDMDPQHSHSNRGTNGTWLANSHPTAIQFQSGDGGVIVRGNTFRNVCRDSSQDTSALNTQARFENNYIEADPSVMGSFSTSNKGVGIIRRDAGVTLIQADCDPASTSYGRILTPGGVATNAMPSTGKYLAGTFIRNTAAATSAGKIIQGWHRLTTGTGHVLGTDWLEMSYVTDINAVLVTATGSTTGRSLAARFAEKYNVKNFGAPADGTTSDTTAFNAALAAATAAGGGVVYFPYSVGGYNYTFTAPPEGVRYEWEGDGNLLERTQTGGSGSMRFSKGSMEHHTGTHNTYRKVSNYIRVKTEGSGFNGPVAASFAQELHVEKDNYLTTTTPGEIDGLYIFIRQGGDTNPATEKSAACAILCDVVGVDGCGYIGVSEAATQLVNSAGVAQKSINIQQGILNGRDGDYHGHLLTASIGTMQVAYSARDTGSATWGDFLRSENGGVNKFKVSMLGKTTTKTDNTGNTEINWANTAGVLEYKNAGGTTLFSVEQTRVKVGSGGISADSTITAAATTGDRTINKPAGSVNIAAAGTSVVVTNSLVTANSIVLADVATADATAYIKNVVPTAGSFTVNLGAAATAETRINWMVFT
jgi:polygalacturonase